MGDVETITNLIEDEVLKKLKGCKSKDEVYKIIEQLQESFIADVECAFNNIGSDYCYENNLEWEE